MYLSDFTLDSLREKVENDNSFQIIITPVFPRQFENVSITANQLHDALELEGYSVLLDDRNQKPRNMFKVAAFLQIPHRITISGRSIEADVYEYFHLETEEFCKIKRENILDFLHSKINPTSY